jgi:HlyD family secretion protein
VALRSPVRGRVLRISEVSERVVPAGASLVEIGDPSRLEVVVDLISSDAVRVHAGDPMWIEGWGGGGLRGRVRRVEPSGFTKVSALGVEEQRVNVIGDFTEPAIGLGDRFRVQIRIAVWQSPSVLRVPGSAVFRHGEGWAVYVVEASRARLREVELGHRTPFEAEVLKGIAGETVVIRDPNDRVQDGVRVRTVR